jgi:type II secretory pathway pseudopilin PulG
MSPVTSSGDDGFTLVEILVAAALFMVLMAMVFTSTVISGQVSSNSMRQGATTDAALTAADEIQRVLSSAIDPTASSFPGDVTNDCSGNDSGTATFQHGDGPFATAPTDSDVAVCGVLPGSSAAYTYEVGFTGCANNVCTLTVTKWPACGSGLEAVTVDAERGVSDDPSPGVFAFEHATASGWSPTTTASDIQAVHVTLAVPASGGAGTTIDRLVLLPNTLPTSEGADT